MGIFLVMGTPWSQAAWTRKVLLYWSFSDSPFYAQDSITCFQAVAECFHHFFISSIVASLIPGLSQIYPAGMENWFLSPWLWDKIWEGPGDKAVWWLEPSIFVLDFILQGWVLQCIWTVHTVCTMLPDSVLTQELAIKANIYAMIYIVVHPDTSMKISVTWVVKMQMFLTTPVI